MLLRTGFIHISLVGLWSITLERHLYRWGLYVVCIIKPSQFTAYTEDIEDIIQMPYHLYADDTQKLTKTCEYTSARLRQSASFT